MTTVTHQAQKGSRTLRLPVAEHEYDLFVSEKTFAKERLEHLYGQYPELFPESCEQGYELDGLVEATRSAVSSPATGGQPHRLYGSPGLCPAIYGRVYGGRVQGVISEAVPCAVLGHCPRLWP